MTDGSLYFVGTATTVIRYAGITVLTDPNFLHAGQRAYLGRGLWSRRLTEPAIDIGALPALDGIVLSHLHGDHFDRVARRHLPRDLPVATTPAAARRLRRFGFGSAQGLGTWESTRWERDGASVTVTALPGRHAPGPAQRLLPPVMGSLLEFRESPAAPPYRIYLTGDTLVIDELAEIPRRQPELDLAVLHLGGTRILGMLVTMDAQQGVDLLELVRPRQAVPVHFDDYGVFRSPLAAFRREVDARRPATQVMYLHRGERLPLRRL